MNFFFACTRLQDTKGRIMYKWILRWSTLSPLSEYHRLARHLQAKPAHDIHLPNGDKVLYLNRYSLIHDPAHKLTTDKILTSGGASGWGTEAAAPPEFELDAPSQSNFLLYITTVNLKQQHKVNCFQRKF